VLRTEVVRESDALLSKGSEFRATFRDDGVLVLLVLYGFVFVSHRFFLS
jgi:hypothetical protein